MKPNLKKYDLIVEFILQLIVLSTFQFIYKNYDRSFENAWVYDSRSVAFFAFFLIYGLLIWNTGRWLSVKLINSSYRNFPTGIKVVVGVVAFTAYGIFSGTVFGAIYYHYFFVEMGLAHVWADYRLLDGDLILIVFIVHLVAFSLDVVRYYTNHLRQAQLAAEQLKKENIQARYQALKNQVDPHFFFNSLSVLTSLVYKDANLSAEYITQLSKMYRYILEGKDQGLATLEEEVKFLNSYIFLIKVRYGNSIQFELRVSDKGTNQVFLPKSSLQMLVENAIKHNRFDENDPLLVSVSEQETFLQVINNKNKRELIEGSSGIGLENIRKRYELIGNQLPEIIETNLSFSVKLPKLTQHEVKHFDF